MPPALVLAALLALAAPARGVGEFPLRVRPTSLLRGPESRPSAVLELRLVRPLAPPARIVLADAAGVAFSEFAPRRNAAGEVLFAVVPLPRRARDGATAIVRLHEGERVAAEVVQVPRPEAGWVLHLVPGFHYDSVWWNTQAHYTETGLRMGSDVGAGHALVQEYLQACANEPDYRVALHQLPYLKTFLEARPWEAPALAGAVRRGRVGLVGGTYDELQSTLVGAEAIARNAVYGALFQREVLGGSGRVAWQCDVFGHDPSFPSLVVRTGHTAAAFARGPFHQWGAPREHVDFPSEFLWMGPDGTGVLTHYMTGHYGYAHGPLAVAAAELAAAGDAADRAPSGAPANAPAASVPRWEQALASMFEDLKRPALTHHVLLPMHSDFARPVPRLGEMVRRWNAAYVSPRVEISTPDAFFDAVRDEVRRRNLVVPVITRDMNPIYTGCPVSFADLKTAERACETTLRDAEIFATFAGLEGAEYPWRTLDRAWRQLLFAAHHDAVTGSMSDQVYVDLLYTYRDALDLATQVRDRALEFLGEPWDGRTTDGPAGAPPIAAQVAGSRVRLHNERLAVEIDLDRGGTIASLCRWPLEADLLRGPGNDVVVLPEHETLPGHGEGPWHLAPTGERRPGTGVRARLLPADAAHPHRVAIEADYPEFTKRQTYELPPGSDQLDMTTEILDWRGANELLRVEFPLDVPGARPVFETAAGVVARPFARDVDTARDPWTLDQAAARWVDLGTTCTLDAVEGDFVWHRRALGVGEIVVEDAAPRGVLESANDLARAFVRAGVTTTITRLGARRYGDLAWDSNLPDFRVALGMSALAALGPPARPPTPAMRYVEHHPSPGDPSRTPLPLLVLPDTAAVGAAIRDLEAAHCVRVPVDAVDVDEPTRPAQFGVAMLNRGSVSVHLTADGTLGLNLLRSCTAWPAGTWIDPPARRLPDGAAFETMHGSHRFEYALLVHDGDWRTAQLPQRAQEYDHPRIVRVLASVRGGATFLQVEPPGVLLAALKPVGFPEARWRTELATPPPVPRLVAVRLWNGTGGRVEARVRSRWFAGAAWRADLLEQRGSRLAVQEGAVRVPLEPFAYETILCEVEPHRASEPPPSLEVATGDSPSAYWLENRGEGATGNGIVSLAPETRTVRLARGMGGVRVFVANNHRTAPMTLALATESTPYLAARLEMPRVTVPPAEAVPVLLSLESGAPTGRWAVPVRADGPGVAVTAAVWVETGDVSSLGEPPFEVRTESPVAAADGVLRATIANHTDGPITGEAAWLAPQFLWAALPSWRHEVRVPARGEATVECRLAGAAGPSWALLRFTAAGRVAYGEPAAVVTDPARVVLRSASERLRARLGGTHELRVTATSLGGLAADARIALAVPEGWSASESRRALRRAGDTTLLDVVFALRAEARTEDASLVLTGPHGSAVRIAATVVPVLGARPLLDAVRIDGDLGEWRDAEFTDAASTLGRARAAVRWSAEGLAFAVVVQDERFVQTHAGADIWEGDSVQFGLTLAPADALGYDAKVLEYGAALGPGGPLVWCWYGGEGGRTGRIAEAPVAVRAGDDGWTRYEVVLPQAALPGFVLAPGSVLGFSYIANDDDGEGFRGAVQWTKGMSGGKDASRFGDLVLEKE